MEACKDIMVESKGSKRKVDELEAVAKTTDVARTGPNGSKISSFQQKTQRLRANFVLPTRSMRSVTPYWPL